jgi:hypothetical protein
MKKREIDFSTRNLQAEILSQHTPWVGTLTQVHKKIITDQKCIESDIIKAALNQTVVFSWTVVFLSVVLEPNEWVVLSWCLPMKKRKIDFSTRNLQAEILSQHTPWVGTLT